MKPAVTDVVADKLKLTLESVSTRNERIAQEFIFQSSPGMEDMALTEPRNIYPLDSN